MSFPRYPKYKDSGVEWLGEVPEHWDVRRLRQIGPLLKGCGGSKQDVVETGVPCVRYGDLYTTHAYMIRQARTCVTEERAADYFPIRRGDVLFAASGEDLAEIGRSAVVLVDERACCGGDLVVLRPDIGVVAEFMGYACDCSVAKSQKASMGRGTTVKHIYPDELKRLLLAVPPRLEQTAIATFLDRETAKIDALIAEQQRLVGLLDEQLKAVVLSAFNAPSTAMVRLGAATDVVSRPLLGESGTTYTRLGLYNRGRGIFHKDPSEPEEMGDSDFFWVEEGDLILSGQFAWEGAVAIAGPEESRCVVSHRYPIVRGKAGILRTEFLFALLCTAHGDFLLNENSRGAAGRNRPLNIGALLKEKVPVPDIRLQDKAAQIYHQRQGLLKEVEIQQALLQERRSALISAAVTGQIDVRGLAGSEAA